MSTATTSELKLFDLRGTVDYTKNEKDVDTNESDCYDSFIETLKGKTT
jgi:hypothetical protein